MKIIIKEAGLNNMVTFSGYHDRENCEDCLTRATFSRVVGKRDEECAMENKNIIRIKVYTNEPSERV